MLFSYPLDGSQIIRKQASLRKKLANDGTNRVCKKIAILGGSTTDAVVKMLDLFLLDNGIKAEFYQSEYAAYWQDVMFKNEDLIEFNPDIIYIHTTSRNVYDFPDVTDSSADVDNLLEEQFLHFKSMWEMTEKLFNVPIIQNNFEMPFYRLLGNSDASDIHGRINFLNLLNQKFYYYSQQKKNFFINDINYISACYGLQKWHSVKDWSLYKYAMAVSAIPEFSFNLSCIIKSILGKNKKAVALDLDNTLWGGVIGDDGIENIEIGQELPASQAYYEFQSYIKKQKQLGIMLTVCSKNDPENAYLGLSHKDSVLKKEDFLVVKANWENKDRNISAIAGELNILPESIVFVDDNPAERAIVKAQFENIAVPDLGLVDSYIQTIDRNGYFEVTYFSDDDINRNKMYEENIKRENLKQEFTDYGEYLNSLEMNAVIEEFKPELIPRIAQLTSKSNQFNLTTKRYSATDIEKIANSEKYISFYGRLSDKFGDNGVVSIVIGEKTEKALHINLWLMSCRVLKRDMELAMLDYLIQKCKEDDINTIYGYYYPTAKNKMVANLYQNFGFEKVSDTEEKTVWSLKTDKYQNKNKHINTGG